MLKALKRKENVLPVNIDENLTLIRRCNAARIVIIVGLNRCPDNSCVHAYDGGDDV